MTPEELQAISDDVGKLDGWDFSSVRVREEAPSWQYEDIVRRHLQRDCVVLDLGTGGGEVFFGFADQIGHGYGIDHESERLRAAVRNQRATAAKNVALAAMKVGSLAFRENGFDVVLARAADYDAAEVARLLRPGGIFITEQIGVRDSQNIFDAFEWGSYGSHWRERFAARGNVYRTTAETAREFEAAGCHVDRYDEYDTPQFYLDVASLVFFLKASPLPWPFDATTYAAPLTRLLETHGSERGIESNAHRELLIVRM